MAEITRPPQSLPTEWKPRHEIEPNDWNPNEMSSEKRRELIHSILDNGWTQPVVCRPDGTILDGEQRWHAARDSRIRTNEDLTPDGVEAGYLPVFTIDPDDAQARVATVQHQVSGEISEAALGEIFATLDDAGLFYSVSERLTLSETGIDRLIARATGDADDPDAFHETPDEPEPDVFDEQIAFACTPAEARQVRAVIDAVGLVPLCRWAIANNVHSQTRVDMRRLAECDAEWDPDEPPVEYPSVDVEQHLRSFLTDDDPSTEG